MGGGRDGSGLGQEGRRKGLETTAGEERRWTADLNGGLSSAERFDLRASGPHGALGGILHPRRGSPLFAPRCSLHPPARSDGERDEKGPAQTLCKGQGRGVEADVERYE